jgi:hypothetical protein
MALRNVSTGGRPRRCWLVMAGWALLARVAWAEPPLKYSFEVGDHLSYERRATLASLASGQVQQQLVQQTDLWCLEKHGAETLILLDWALRTAERAEPRRGVLLYVDEHGRRRMADAPQAQPDEADPACEVLPVLRLPIQEGTAWETAPDFSGARRRCKSTGPDEQRAGHVRVEYFVEPPPAFEAALPGSHVGRYWFDPAAGLVTRVESLQEDRTANLRTEAVTVLRQRERQPAAWTQRRAAEAGRYLQALRREERLLDAVVRQPQQIEQTLERLSRLWADRAVAVERQVGSPFERLVWGRQQRVAAQEGLRRAEAAYAGRWLEHRALPWTLEGPTGETLTSEAARAGVVIECLWSMETPDALATLEGLCTLPVQPDGHAVRAICLNMDADVLRVRRLIARLPTGPTHVLAGPLRAVEQPPRLPVVRLLDSSGVIRRIWIGGRSSYAEVLEEAARLK